MQQKFNIFLIIYRISCCSGSLCTDTDRQDTWISQPEHILVGLIISHKQGLFRSGMGHQQQQGIPLVRYPLRDQVLNKFTPDSSGRWIKLLNGCQQSGVGYRMISNMTVMQRQGTALLLKIQLL